MAIALNVILGRDFGTSHLQTFAPFLELCLAQTNSQGAYLYRLERDTLQLAESSGRAASAMERFEAALSTQAAQWHRENLDAVFLDRSAWSDWRLERFPEFLHNRFEAAAAVPLAEHGRVIGLLHVCRVAAAPYQARERAFLRSLGLPLGSLAAHAEARVRLESEVETLSRKLAERKLLDRAKGILQARFQWTEEEAYLFLRRSSRQRRTAMRLIAQEVIAQEVIAQEALDEPLRAAQ
uniref:Response regulator receiver and ANTAR domain protein n=1 Tax=Solibacter usitatus (strain Ellin6076) TaxID=234267 RepID=Q01UJ2_SOLUE